MPRLRSNSLLSLDELREAVAEAVEADGRSHAEIQRSLGMKGRGIIARALDPKTGTRYAGTLSTVLHHLTGYSADAETRYRLSNRSE